LELRRYLTVLRSRLWLILITTLLAAGVGYTVSNKEAEYVARSTLYVGSTNINPDPLGGELTNDRITALSTIVFTFAKMIDSEPIALRAVQDLDLNLSTADIVEATETTPDLQLLYIDVTEKDPELAQSLANGLADSFVEAVQEFEPAGADEEGAVPRLPAYVFERAQLPTAPVPTDQFQSVLLAALFGLLVSAGMAFLLDYLDLSIRTASDVERRLELPVLGVIPALGDDVPLGEWTGARRGRKT
jgi:capsular polysaccharide biosynthesis protein